MFVPIVNVVVTILVAVDLARAFGRDGGFAILLVLLPFVGFPMLAFSATAVYRGPVADPMYQQAMWAQYGYPPPGYPPQGYPRQLGYPPQQPYPGMPPQQAGYPPRY